MRRSRAPSKLGKGKTPPLVATIAGDSRGAASAIGSAPRPLGERNRNGGVGTPPSPPFAAAPARPTAASVVAEARRPSAAACTAGEQRLVEGALGGPLSLRDDVDPEAYRRSTAPVAAPLDRSDVMEEPSEPELGAEGANGSPEPIAQLPEPGTEAADEGQGAAEGGAAAMEEEGEEEEEDRLDMSAVPPLAAELLVGTWCAIGRITINDTTTRLEEKFVLRAEGGGVAGGGDAGRQQRHARRDVGGRLQRHLPRRPRGRGRAARAAAAAAGGGAGARRGGGRDGGRFGG